jgi:hypothetical protein
LCVHDKGVVISVQSLGSLLNITGVIKHNNLPPQYQFTAGADSRRSGLPDAALSIDPNLSNHLELLKVHFPAGQKVSCRILDKYPVNDAVSMVTLRRKELAAGAAAAEQVLSTGRPGAKQQLPYQFSLELEEVLPDDASISPYYASEKSVQGNGSQGVVAVDDGYDSDAVDENSYGDDVYEDTGYDSDDDSNSSPGDHKPEGKVRSDKPPQHQAKRPASVSPFPHHQRAATRVYARKNSNYDTGEDGDDVDDEFMTRLEIEDEELDELPRIMPASMNRAGSRAGSNNKQHQSGPGRSDSADDDEDEAEVNTADTEKYYNEQLEKKFYSLANKQTNTVSADIFKKSEGVHAFIEWGDLAMADIDAILTANGVNIADPRAANYGQMNMDQFKACSQQIFEMLTDRISDGSLINRRSDEDIAEEAKMSFRSLLVKKNAESSKVQQFDHIGVAYLQLNDVINHIHR